jgi:hypothetical protein
MFTAGDRADGAGFRAFRTAGQRLVAVVTLKSGVQIRAEVASLRVDVGRDGRVTGIRAEADGAAQSQLAWVDVGEVAAVTAEFAADPTVTATVEGTIFKKCSREWHRPDSRKACADGSCKHTCDPTEVETCRHKWTFRYSIDGQQSEKSFPSRDEARMFQLELSAAKTVAHAGRA